MTPEWLGVLGSFFRTEVIVAVIACFGIITAAVLTYLGVKRSSDMSRVTQLETRLNQSDAINKGMWIWNRGLQDQVWKQAPPPPLDPPDWLTTLLDK